MADCERLDNCPFFKNLKHLPRTAEQLTVRYCRGDNSGCARLWVFSNGALPPDDLFPNEGERALRVLSQSGKVATSIPPTAQKQTSNKPCGS